MVASDVLHFLLDASVPDSVGHTLRDSGHKVTLHREVLDDGAKDPVVCQTAIANDAILVAVDGDMFRHASRLGQTDVRFTNLNLVQLTCPSIMAAARVGQALSLIEHEWKYSERKRARRVLVQIEKQKIVSWR